MPGPGRRGKSKKSTGSRSVQSVVSTRAGARDAFVDDVDGADGWTPVVHILCAVFDLPDLSSRRGLKKVHANFDSIYKKLQSAYEKNPDNERIKGGIVAIYSKMCMDALLRNKLCDRGLLDKIIPLLQIDSTRRMAFRALVTVTHHGGAEIRSKIATYSSTVTALMESFSDDEDICEMGVSVLSHAVGAVVEGSQSGCAYPAILKKLDMAKILKVVVQAVKAFPSNTVLFEHGTELIAVSAMHASNAFDSALEAKCYLVAGMHCPDWVIRAQCLAGLTHLHITGAENDRRDIDPQRLMAAARGGMPSYLDDEEDPFRSEIFSTTLALKNFQTAIMQVTQDRNMYNLGMQLARLILTSENSIGDGYFETINERTGRREQIDVGLPFQRYPDALPACARVIRQRGKPEDVDVADILDIKFRIMKGRVGEAVKIAQKALERNTENAYFYYAISLSANRTAGLHAAKKGLKCKEITPFVHWQLVQRAVDHAGDLGRTILQTQTSTGANEEKLEEGIAFLQSAYEDARIYLAGAPPDNLNRRNVAYWYILLTILMTETLSPDLHELQEAINKLTRADECGEFLGVPAAKTMLRRTQETAVELLPESMKEFEKVFDRGENAALQAKEKEEKASLDDLSAWLDKVSLEDGEEAAPREHQFSNIKVNMSRIGLYRCSHCRNPSAALKKCSGCAQSRYCDSKCQKGHWPEHKKQCKPSVPKNST